MFEAASCAIHGLDRIAPKAGSTVLMIGAGPTGLCLAQLLKLNGAAHMVLAANAGPKMELAKKLACADEYVDLDREHPQAQWAELKEKYAYGFDVVIEASGSVQVLKDSIGYVARGGTLLYYGVYPKQALVDVSPSKVFGDEITIIGYVGLLRRDVSEKFLLTARGPGRIRRCGACRARFSTWKVGRWMFGGSSRILLPSRISERHWMQ